MRFHSLRIAALFTPVLMEHYTELEARNVNFTDFSDDLTDLKYNHKGVFVNLIGTM